MFFAAEDGKDSESSSSSLPCRPFEFAEIQLATDNFDESLVIGSGGFGKVYKGTIVNGASLVAAAIKRLDSVSKQGATEFWAEVETLSKMRHSHLVSLIGYCNDGKEMILVYEYMPHGTLEDHLYRLCTPLSWLQRLKICINAARGLEFLHTGMGIEHRVIHRDVKSSNILLHENWAAKISDFGLSRIGTKDQPTTYVGTKVKGTFGYLDPNYFRTGRLTRKSDVYAFGVVLFEVLYRKRAVDGSPDDEDWGLAGWAQESIKEGSLRHIVDYELRDQISSKCLKDFARIADCCLHDDPKKRPMITEVVLDLEAVLALQVKNNHSLQHAGKTFFGRMVYMLPFPSKREHSGDVLDSKLSNGKAVDNTSATIPSPYLKVLKFSALRRATCDFSLDMLLRHEGSGDVFLGWVDNKTFAASKPGVGMAVAVKRQRHVYSDRDDEWLTEVGLLGRLAHPHIVRLLGYSSYKQENLLVYENMQNGSFHDFLFKNNEPLSWGRRLNVMIGVARGLVYLHSLLDQDFNAKLGDFGCARCGPQIVKTHVSTSIKGTLSYLDPEFFRTGKMTAKGHVYNFGMVLLETLTGEKIMSFERPLKRQNLASWVRILVANDDFKERELEKIMDPHLGRNYPLEAAFRCVELAVRCIAFIRKDRPSSEEILRSLEAIDVFTSNG